MNKNRLKKTERNSANWKTVIFSEVVDIISGGTPKTSVPEYWNGTIPWISITDFGKGRRWITATEKHISKEGLENSPTKLLHKGQLIISARGTVGELGQVTKDMAFNQSCYGLDGGQTVNNDFLYYCLKNLIGNIQSKTHGSVFNTITRKTFDQVAINIPPLPEQHRIAKVLSDLDSKIELNDQMNKTLEAIGQALFKHWFVDFEFPNKQGKPYKSSGGRMVYNEELKKEVPEGWKVGKLADFVSVIKGVSYKSSELKDSKTALVTLKSVGRGGGFQAEGFKEYIGKFKPAQILKNGDIIVAQTDLTQNAEVLGKPARVQSVQKYQTLVASLDLVVVRPIKLLNNDFLYYLLRSEDFQSHAIGYANGTTVLHLSARAIPEYRTLVPDKEIIDKFGTLMMNGFRKQLITESESVVLQQLRDSLLPKLMSGQIRVHIHD
ncbi:restriction endonuclease subunit S [Candidatus Woesearchaeota archaeon]|nr:MAG: restriction endonuclease subunit S [Candidatus Woesearchaeota archaeon]